MADHFDVVSVGVKNKGCIVPPTVLRTQSGRSVVLPARAKSGAMERVDLMSVLGDECNVQMRGLLFRLVQAQGARARWLTKFSTIWRPIRDDSHSNWFERLQVEGSAQRKVAYAEFYMVKHEYPLLFFVGRAVAFSMA